MLPFVRPRHSAPGVSRCSGCQVARARPTSCCSSSSSALRVLSLSHYSVLAFALTQSHSNLILTALVTYFRIYIFKLLFILFFPLFNFFLYLLLSYSFTYFDLIYSLFFFRSPVYKLPPPLGPSPFFPLTSVTLCRVCLFRHTY